jgi:hypothetical protein
MWIGVWYYFSTEVKERKVTLDFILFLKMKTEEVLWSYIEVAKVHCMYLLFCVFWFCNKWVFKFLHWHEAMSMKMNLWKQQWRDECGWLLVCENKFKEVSDGIKKRTKF